MSITYPLTLPKVPSQYVLTQNNNNAMTASIFTGQQYVYDWTGQWWSVSIQFPTNDRAAYSTLLAFIAALKGKGGTFYFGPMGKEATPLGAGGGTPLVNGGSQGGNSVLITDGWPNSTTVLKAGDFFSIGTGSGVHLYRALEDVVSDSSGNATFACFPNVRSVTADNDIITITNPVGIFRASDDVSYTLGAGSFYTSISINAIEVI